MFPTGSECCVETSLRPRGALLLDCLYVRGHRRFHAFLLLFSCSYVRLQQNGSGVVGIDLFTPLGTLTFYNDITQLITSWDVYSNIG